MIVFFVENFIVVGGGPLTVINLKMMDFTFYRNPLAKVLTITKTTPNQLISVMGTRVLGKVWNSGSLTTQLDLSALNSGIYCINISNDNNIIITQKIVISN